jgi:hypothetical protein
MAFGPRMAPCQGEAPLIASAHGGRMHALKAGCFSSSSSSSSACGGRCELAAANMHAAPAAITAGPCARLGV